MRCGPRSIAAKYGQAVVRSCGDQTWRGFEDDDWHLLSFARQGFQGIPTSISAFGAGQSSGLHALGAASQIVSYAFLRAERA
jgi:hypothetical protein